MQIFGKSLRFSCKYHFFISFTTHRGNIQILKESIHLNDNKLKYLPVEICNLIALEVLDIRNNEIETLPLKLHSIVCIDLMCSMLLL